MFALLAAGMWTEFFHPWVVRCNSDKTDCHTFWRKSRTAYMSEHETLTDWMISMGAYTPEEATPAAGPVPVVQAVPIAEAVSA